MMHLAHTAYQLAALSYLGAFVLLLLPSKRQLCIRFVLLFAVLANLVTVVVRYIQSWPMLPMHLSPVGISLCAGALILWFSWKTAPEDRVVHRIILGVLFLLMLATIFYPKDFYLPFLKSKTLLSHCFLWFSIFAKSCCLMSAAWALVAWPLQSKGGHGLRPSIALQHSLRWAALGFCLWTLSMFCGELWCYLGWGTPVVWEDPALTLTMAGWFFYACVLHLHLTKAWNQTARAAFIGCGGLLVLGISCLPDFGPFRLLVMP